MNDENLTKTPILEETSYDPNSAKKNNSLEGIAVPVLDDMDYTPINKEKKGAPTGISAPVLDDFNDYTPSNSKKDVPTGISAPVLDDMTSLDNNNSENKIVDETQEIISGFTPEQKQIYDKLPEAKKIQVIEMRKQQLAEIAKQKTASETTNKSLEPEIKAPILEENEYIPKPKVNEPVSSEKENTSPVSAPILDDEPKPTGYVSKFVDEDLEKAKKEGAKRSVDAQLVSKQKDEKESLNMLKQLKEEQRERDAEEGFKISIRLAIIGVISAVMFYFFVSGEFFGLGYKESAANKMVEIISQYSLYISLAIGGLSALLITGIRFVKSITTLVSLLYSIINIFPGILIITQKDGGMALNIVFYAISLVGAIYLFVSLTGNEKVSLYFDRR